MKRKELATSFLELAASGKVAEAYEKYVHANFKHHNTYFNGDRETLLKAMEEAHVSSPNEFFKVQHTFEDDELVAVHSHLRKKDGADIAVVHMFRFEDNKIIELWDVGMIVPKDSPNENGVF